MKPHILLALCEHRLPRLTDGAIKLTYYGCDSLGMDIHKYYHLPIDTCQSTHGAKGLKITRPAICKDSRARLARYLDDGCNELSDITDVSDEDLAWDACQVLDDTIPHSGSFTFLCDGLDDVTKTGQAVIEAAKMRDLPMLDAASKLQTTEEPIPSKPWVPFWQGLVLVEQLQSGSRDDQYQFPLFEVIHRDRCYSVINSPLRIYQVPRCWNGTRAHVAFFTWIMCRGTPIFMNNNNNQVLEHQFCMSDSTGYNTMAFWCNGQGLTNHLFPTPL